MEADARKMIMIMLRTTMLRRMMKRRMITLRKIRWRMMMLRKMRLMMVMTVRGKIDPTTVTQTLCEPSQPNALGHVRKNHFMQKF